MSRIWLKRLAERHGPAPVLSVARGVSRRLARRRLLRRISALRRDHDTRNSGLPADELRLPGGVILKVTPFVREQYEYFCYRDPDIVAEWNAFARLTAGKTALLDIGAEHGFFSLAFACGGLVGRRAIAVEPSPVAYPVLQSQIRVHSQAAVTALNIAVADNDGEIEMAVRENHAVTAFGFYGDLPGERIVVPVRTVDAVCHEHRFVPDVMKIDVEGFELNVIRGARDVLRKCSPLLFLEIHPGMLSSLGQTVADLLALLAAYGYRNIDPTTGKVCDPTVVPSAGSQRLVFKSDRQRA